MKKTISRLLVALAAAVILSSCTHSLNSISNGLLNSSGITTTAPPATHTVKSTLEISIELSQGTAVPGTVTPQATKTHPSVTYHTTEERITPKPDLESSGTPIATPCVSYECAYSGFLFLARPIGSPNNDQLDPSYRYGSTQENQRPPHHGIEFPNPPGAPVQAAADGMVVIAGNDLEKRYGPFLNFYGNLVVIQHKMPEQVLPSDLMVSGPIYTLYGHLSKILVEPGQVVSQGQEIGQVGMTGTATGNHLHFEVRLGKNDYMATRNPELWLTPHLGETGLPNGAIAGRVVNGQGKIISVKNIIIQYLPEGPDGPTLRGKYLDAYEEDAILNQLPWKECFAIGDLTSGWYRVSFTYLGVQTRDVQVFPGEITMILFELKEE